MNQERPSDFYAHSLESKVTFLQNYQTFTKKAAESRSLWRTPTQFPVSQVDQVKLIWASPITKMMVLAVGCFAGIHLALRVSQLQHSTVPSHAQTQLQSKPL